MKNHLLSVLFVGLFALLQFPVALALDKQWTSNGPYGGSISALAIDPANPATLYAGTSGWVFKSTDGGGNWSPSNIGLTATSDNALDALVNINALAIDPVNTATLYAGTYGGVFKSTDGGVSWNPANTGLTVKSVLILTISPADPSTLYAGTPNGVFKSADGGGSWSTTNTGLPALDSDDPAFTGLSTASVGTLAIDPANPTTIYAGTDWTFNGVFKSTDGGDSWNPVNNGLPAVSVLALAIDAANPNTLYAGTSNGVFKSTDGGENWSLANSDSTAATVNALVIDPANSAALYAGTQSGVFKSTDAGGNWSPANTGLTIASVQVLAIDRANPAALYAGTQTGVFKSTDGGGSWISANTGLSAISVDALAIDPAKPATLYAGALAGCSRAPMAEKVGAQSITACQLHGLMRVRLKVRFKFKRLDAVDSSIHPICYWLD